MNSWLTLIALLVQPAPEPLQVDLIWSTDCPVAQRWVTKVAAWSKAHPSVRPVLWFPNDDLPTASAYVKRFGLAGDLKALQGADLAYQFGLDRLPGAIVRSGTRVVYVGGVGLSAEPTSRFMLAEAVASGTVTPSRSTPQGCTIPDPLVEKSGSPVDFIRHVKPVLDRFCVSCHSPSGAAPFRLDRYEDAKRWSHMIADVLRRKTMPPVKVYDRTGPKRSVEPSSEDLDRIITWREYGAPMESGPSTASRGDLGNPAVFPAMALPPVPRPRVGEPRFVDVPVGTRLRSLKSYRLAGSRDGDIRMSWLFASKQAPIAVVDGGRRWKSLPPGSRLLFATQTTHLEARDHIELAADERLFLRLALYGTDREGPIRPLITLVDGDRRAPAAQTAVIKIDSGRYQAFDGTVDLFEAVRFRRGLKITAVTPVTDPIAPEITLQGPKAAFLVAQMHEPIPTIVLQKPMTLDQLNFVVRYGGPSMTGEKSLRAITIGDQWNGTTAELWIRYQIP